MIQYNNMDNITFYMIHAVYQYKGPFCYGVGDKWDFSFWLALATSSAQKINKHSSQKPQLLLKAIITLLQYYYRDTTCSK